MPSDESSLRTAAQVRAIDRAAIEELGIPGYTLMLRAGAAAFATLEQVWPKARRIVVVCGAGNNAGDGYVLARLARQQRLDVFAMRLAEPARLRGDAKRAWEDFAAEGGMAVGFDESLLDDADVIVDAILGTGLTRAVEEPLYGCIARINASGVPVLALDVPSGLDADTGQVHGIAVRATHCVTFVARKIGFHLGAGPDHVGVVSLETLSVPEEAAAAVDRVARLIEPAVIRETLPSRARTAHKGDFGHVLVVGGGPGMPGAARLSGEGALRVGAGRVTVACAAGNVPAIVGSRPELMCVGVEHPAELDRLLERVDVVAVGPGLGTENWGRALFDQVVASGKLLVVDADALNLLAQRPRPHEHWVLTPHPGEASRLLGSQGAAVQADRLGAVRSLVDRYGGVAVLKGASTIVAREGDLPRICNRGNPGMASPGVGDVLTGMIAGLAAQCGDAWLAAQSGVYAHALAGDTVAQTLGERGLLAGDLLERLPTCLNRAG